LNEPSAGGPRTWLFGLDDFEADRRTAIHEPAVVRAALDALGSPDAALRVVSVAGTAGKGSVATVLAALLQLAGLRTALYRSPHLCRYEERFVVALEAVRPDVLDEELEQLRLATEVGILPPLTRFEVETVLAVAIAAREGCEVLVAEAGLGAARDATAALEAELAIVTALGEDHLDELGGTVEAVAAQELGIAVRTPRVLLGELGPAGERIWAELGWHGEALVRLGTERTIARRTPGVKGQAVLLGDGREFLVPFLGRPAAQAVALGVWGAEELLGTELGAGAVDGLLSGIALPGAPWLHAGPPRVVSDLAHNALATAALTETLQEAFGEEVVWSLVIGLSHGRDPERVLGPLEALVVREVVAVDAGVAPEAILGTAERLWPRAPRAVAAGPFEAARRIGERDPEAWVLATGSLRVAAPLRCAEGGGAILRDDLR
jgi:dihydrofolate synthase/folylpolyglutamate synthase